MLDLNDWIAWFAVGAFLIMPILYAVGTLHRMREKWIYPLLRYRERDGSLGSVTTDDRPYAKAHLGESSPPMQLTRHLLRSIH